MLCLHHNDPDGRGAAAVVRRRLGPSVRCIETDYSRPVPWDEIARGEDVVVVDYSLRGGDWPRLRERAGAVTWIDHHASSLAEGAGEPPLPGLRSVDQAACELAWAFYFPGEPVPRAVQLVGDRDRWIWQYGAETANFHEGLKLYPQQPADAVWTSLLNNDGALLREVLERGATCVEYRLRICAEFVRDHCFELTFEGCRCICANLKMFGSEVFGERLADYDMGITFGYSGRKWGVTLYSRTRDVLPIAVKYGGGGHPRAAGFPCERLPFL